MSKEEKGPGTVEAATKANTNVNQFDKDMNNSLKTDIQETIHKRINFENPIRQRIYELFLTGEKFSIVQLTMMLRVPDVRSHIRFIRDSGVSISDYWQKSEFSKYKVYFLHKVK